jgi:hypothetical protein
MAEKVLRTGKKMRPKSAVKGKRFRCAMCHRRSPKPVKTLAPWYCPICARQKEELDRRQANLLKNPASGLSWDEVVKRVRSRYRR